jgi:hypothetical protein
VLVDAQPAALLAGVSLAVVLADARPAALFAPAFYVVVLADARPAALLALASLAVVLADARPAALLALASLAVVLADARPAALLGLALDAIVLADARPAAFLTSASFGGCAQGNAAGHGKYDMLCDVMDHRFDCDRTARRPFVLPSSRDHIFAHLLDSKAKTCKLIIKPSVK